MSLLSYLNRFSDSASGYTPTERVGGIAHRITAITAVNLAGAGIGAGALNPVAGDTEISSILIPANATAVTVTLTGFAQDETGTARTITLTGSTTVDTYYPFDQLVNYAAAAQITCSVASLVVVWHGAP